MDLKAILSDLDICKDVIKMILQYNATLLGFVPFLNGSISVQNFQTQKQVNLLQIDAFDVRYKYFHSKVLIIPEFHWLVRVQGGFHVRIWDLDALHGNPFYSQSVCHRDVSRIRAEDTCIEFMFWVPDLKKVVMINSDQIFILTLNRQSKKVLLETIYQIAEEKESNVPLHLKHAQPDVSNSFQFLLIYRVSRRHSLQTRLKTFNVETGEMKSITTNHYHGCKILKIWPVTKTSSLLMISKENNNKSFLFHDRQTNVQYPVYVDGIVGFFEGELMDCLHVNDFHYRLIYKDDPGHACIPFTATAVLQLIDNEYTFLITRFNLWQNPYREKAVMLNGNGYIAVKEVMLSDHHYGEPLKRWNHLDWVLLMLVLCVVLVWWCCRV